MAADAALRYASLHAKNLRHSNFRNAASDPFFVYMANDLKKDHMVASLIISNLSQILSSANFVCSIFYRVYYPYF